MSDVGCSRHKIMSFHKFAVSPHAQIQPVPEGGPPDGCREIMRDGNMFKEAMTRFQFMDGLRVQSNAGPQQKWTVIAKADIHILRFDIGKQFCILTQGAPVEPAKRFLSLFN